MPVLDWIREKGGGEPSSRGSLSAHSLRQGQERWGFGRGQPLGLRPDHKREGAPPVLRGQGEVHLYRSALQYRQRGLGL